MAMSASALSLENEVFSMFAFYATVVLLKTVFMAFWVTRHRIPKKVFSTPEDYDGLDQPATTTDPDVERVRRCHQNDIEAVFPFVLVGLLYVHIGPDPYTAALHFRLFTVFRLLHTFVYLNAIRQPTRIICWMVNVGVISSMAIAILLKTNY